MGYQEGVDEMNRNAILQALTDNVTMNDDQFVTFLHTLGTDALGMFGALQELMAMVEDGTVIMSKRVDATGKTTGGVYSLPSMQRLTRLAEKA